MMPAPNLLPLTLLLSSYASLHAVLNSLKHSLPAETLSPQERAQLNALPQALAQLGAQQANALNASLKRLSRAPRRFSQPVIWQRGTTKLIDFSTNAHLPTVLVVPSLINRAYILDLLESRSFMRRLSKHCSPLLIDWDAPGEEEQLFNAEAYVRERLMPALEWVVRTTGAPAHVLGYCMGGVLSLGLTTRMPKHVASLGLLATPWDFNSADRTIPHLPPAMLTQIDAQMRARKTIPAAFLQSLFYLQNMDVMMEKYERFAHMSERDEGFEEFVALEGWLADGVDMSAPAARDALIEWPQRNQLAKRQWIANPAGITCPVFIAAPKYDKIVPSGCARSLTPYFPHASVVEPQSGHVGMVIGSKVEQELIKPYAAFLKNS